MTILPTTALGRIGVAISALALALYVLLFALFERVIDDAGAPVVGWGPPVLAMTVGAAVVLVAIARRGERSLVAWIALLPGAFFAVLVVLELLGLIE